MPFVTINPGIDSGELKGDQEPVAVECWFSSTGKMVPLMIKCMDREGILHKIDKIKMEVVEDKTYYGQGVKEFLCHAIYEDRLCRFRLIFKKETNKWFVTWM